MNPFGMFGAGHLLIALIIFCVLFFPYVRIIQKAGYSGWWILIAFVPVVNFVMLWVFALADWPVLRGVSRT